MVPQGSIGTRRCGVDEREVWAWKLGGTNSILLILVLIAWGIDTQQEIVTSFSACHLGPV